MQKIDGFLKKYKKITDDADINRIGVANIIRKVCKIDIDSNKVNIKQKTALLKLRSAEKSLIIQKKEKILSAIREGGFDILDVGF
jgi:hypothetical protein